MRTLSETFRDAMFLPETDECPLVLLDIAYELGGTQHIRIVNDWQDIVSNGQTFTAYPFEIVLPQEEGDRPPQASIKICNVDRSLMTAIRSVTTPPTITLQVVLASAPNDVEIEVADMTLRGVEYTAHAITGLLSFEAVLEEQFPGNAMTPGNFPGVFGGLPPGAEWITGDDLETEAEIGIPKRAETTTTTTGRRGHR